MWIDVDGNGTRFLNINRITMISIDKDDNSMVVCFDGENYKYFKDVDAVGIIEQFRIRRVDE